MSATAPTTIVVVPMKEFSPFAAPPTAPPTAAAGPAASLPGGAASNIGAGGVNDSHWLVPRPEWKLPGDDLQFLRTSSNTAALLSFALRFH